mmetsp:Transcript_18790/g.23058  ORF Transcript_18790/g.23058 Transcript_18790/m.23058 type:complete len:611 (+) Transcript_18790:40-1872(+)
MGNQREAHAYHDPTILFQLINNKKISDAISRVQSNPEEVKVWIVNRSSDDKSGATLWKYLPLHLVCLSLQEIKSNIEDYHALKELILNLVNVYPKAVLSRDYAGNLPVHYVLTEGCNDESLLNMLVDDELTCLSKKDGRGKVMEDIIKGTNGSKQCKGHMKKWFLQVQCEQQNQQHQQLSKPIAITPIQCSEQKSRKYNEKQQTIEKIQWECISKDSKIDSLTAQVLSLEKKLEREKYKHVKTAKAATKQRQYVGTSNVIDTNHDNNHRSSTTLLSVELDMKEEIESLKEKAKIDCNIVTAQNEQIKRLEEKLKDEQIQKEKYQAEAITAKQILEEQKRKNHKHDDAIQHLRKVTDILQNEIDAKDEGVVKLKLYLEKSESENKRLEQILLSKEQELANKTIVFQNELKGQNEKLSQALSMLNNKLDNLEQRSYDNGNRNNQFFATDSPFSPLDNTEKISGIPKGINIDVNVSSSSSKMNEERNISSKLYGSDSISQEQQFPRNIFSSSQPMISKTSNLSKSMTKEEIEQKQGELRKELKDLYNQIKSVLPPQSTTRSRISLPSQESGDNTDIAIQRRLRTLREQHRPWKSEKERTSATELGSGLVIPAM